MGADLYIESISNANAAAHMPAFDAAVAARDAFTALHPDKLFAQPDLGSPEIYRKQRQAENAASEELQAEYDRLQEKVGEAFGKMNAEDGYFRDSYNDSSIAWVLGISWWNDVIPMLDQEGYLPIDKARELLTRVEAAPVTLKAITGKYRDEPREKVIEYYEGKKRRLIEFLKRSIEMNEPILCSL